MHEYHWGNLQVRNDHLVAAAREGMRGGCTHRKLMRGFEVTIALTTGYHTKTKLVTLKIFFSVCS